VKLRFKSPISVAIAMSFGIVVLLGYFFGSNSAGEPTMLGVLRDYFLRGGVVMAAIALFVGIANLASVHIRKIQKRETIGYSSFLLAAMFGTIAIGIFEISGTQIIEGQNNNWIQWIFENIQLPIETSLMALLAISLTYAATRLFSKRMTVFSVIFVGSLLVILLGTIPQLTSKMPLFGELRAWIIQVPAVGGARGILLGVGLGTIATGIRILMGRDRPYRG
jgi:predicted benzoate:H+ symporter BenE